MMILKEILDFLAHPQAQSYKDVRVKNVQERSDLVEPGDLFLAIPSLSGKDVHAHALEAVQKGAVAIVADLDLYKILQAQNLGTLLVGVDDIRWARAKLAAYLFPHQPKHLVAITGTNGKTSCAHFFRQICLFLGKESGSLGTLGVQANPSWVKSLSYAMTSPNPFFLHQVLDRFAREHIDYVALEASSHGIHQKRLECVDFEAAAFTNLSHEHLDYHGSLEEYFEAKKRLFSQMLGEGMTAVLNADDTHSRELIRLCQKRQERVITYGYDGKDMRLVDVILTEHGQTLTVEAFGRVFKIDLPLMGIFQAMNALCAASLAVAVGLPCADVMASLAHLKNVPGRLEYVGRTHQGGHVYVDYAHTPHALETVLTSVKPHLKGPLVVVFGCGGERDTQKRRAMGEIAATHASRVIVTDDNPRGENPGTIRAAILATCPEAMEIGDRHKAIETAIKGLGEHGVCVIAGKGHEQGQLVAGHVIPFDDVRVAKEVLSALKGVPS